MKAGWEIKTLDEVCIVERGSSPRPIKEFFTTEPDGVNWIKIGDTEEGGKYVFSTRQKITPEGAKQSRYVKEGDFILTNSMSFGRPYIMKTDGYIHDGWFVLRLKDSIDADYFYHLLSSNLIQEQFTQLAAGAIVKNISGDLVKKAVLPIAPLPEQKRLVTLLDEAFESIATAKANAQQNLKNARALFESHLNEVFTKRGEGWIENTKPLADLCELIVDCEHKTAPTQEEGIPSIRTPNIGKGKLLLDGVYRVSEETYKEWTRRAEPQAGDLILAREAPAGNVAIIPENIKVCLGQRTVLIRPSRNVFEPEFLTLMLLQPQMQQKLLAHSRGATVQHVNMKDIRALNVGEIPSLSIQKDIVAVMNNLTEETQHLEALYSRKIAALNELKKALLHRAFSGEL